MHVVMNSRKFIVPEEATVPSRGKALAKPDTTSRKLAKKRCDAPERIIVYQRRRAPLGWACSGCSLMPEYDRVAKFSYIPRGQAGGLTLHAPIEERFESGLYSQSYLENQGAVDLGGRFIRRSFSFWLMLEDYMSSQKDYSMATTDVVDAEVRELVEKAYARAKQIIATHVDILHKLA
ncbi:hypothetical protein MLD38_000823 [Melastoma candidum]|uniref:Uncharacterized protein n=1 Tax=Melastoma candidum TaxID=119954 RepID=A0ACB9SCK0_9MYRT|nr:hypothetical protein MLD38_000823 [Melastoma candidum]